MGYRYNINRSKTCSYCHGDHAILDCTKIVADGKEALRIRLLEQQDYNAFVEEFAKKTVRYAAYSRHDDSVNSKSVWGIVDKTLPHEQQTIKITVNKQKAIEITDWVQSGGYWRYPDEVKALVEDTDWVLDILTNEVLPFDGSSRDQWHKQRMEHWDYPDLYLTGRRNDTIRWYEKNEAKKAARANKKCSYCRESGHTVRTCPQKSIDAQLHHDAYKIWAYHTARALSRFGLWSGAMIKVQEFNHETGDSAPKLYHLPTNFCNSLRFRVVDLEDSMALMSIDDRTVEVLSAYDTADFIYATGASAMAGFYPLGHSQRESWRWRANLGIHEGAKRRDIERFDFSSEHGTIGCTYSDGTKNDAKEFYPVRTTLEHIYSRILSAYKAPKPANDRYSQPRLEWVTSERLKQYCNLGDPSDHYNHYRWRTDCIEYYSSDLFEKKQRNQLPWKRLQQYVENNQEILNKANSLSV